VLIDVIKLEDHKNQWVIGTHPKMATELPGYSNSIEIKYKVNPNLIEHHQREQYHSHSNNIEECYLVLHGWLKVLVEGQIIKLVKKQIIRIPSHVCHKIADFSANVEYLTIRAPTSDETSKNVCE
jgi:mannose-6-phosphate isomerase-like protein (cupin superfamily)